MLTSLLTPTLARQAARSLRRTGGRALATGLIAMAAMIWVGETSPAWIAAASGAMPGPEAPTVIETAHRA